MEPAVAKDRIRAMRSVLTVSLIFALSAAGLSWPGSVRAEAVDTEAVIDPTESTNKNSRSRLLESRNGWIMSSPPSHVLWSVYKKHAEEAAGKGEHHKALVLSEAAIEHVRHLNKESARKKETLEMVDRHSKANEIEIHWPTLEKVAATPYSPSHPGYMKKDPPRVTEKQSSYIDKIREADLLNAEGESEKAEALYVSALKQLSGLKSTDGMLLVKLIDRVTRLYYRDNKFQKAEEIIREHIFRHDSMWERLGPADEDRLQIAFLLSDLGLVYTGMNRYFEAEAVTEEALSIVKRFRGEKDADYIVMLGALARLHKYMGLYDESRKEYRSAIALADENKQISKSSKAVILGNYFKLLQKMGKSREASKIASKANELKPGTVNQ